MLRLRIRISGSGSPDPDLRIRILFRIWQCWSPPRQSFISVSDVTNVLFNFLVKCFWKNFFVLILIVHSVDVPLTELSATLSFAQFA
jgi:hypothetical protein